MINFPKEGKGGEEKCAGYGKTPHGSPAFGPQRPRRARFITGKIRGVEGTRAPSTVKHPIIDGRSSLSDGGVLVYRREHTRSFPRVGGTRAPSTVKHPIIDGRSPLSNGGELVYRREHSRSFQRVEESGARGAPGYPIAPRRSRLSGRGAWLYNRSART